MEQKLTKRAFTAKLNRVSKNILRVVIPSLGLHERSEKALKMKYIDEKCMWDIADELGITYGSASNVLCNARAEMYELMISPSQILTEDTQDAIMKFLGGTK